MRESSQNMWRRATGYRGAGDYISYGGGGGGGTTWNLPFANGFFGSGNNTSANIQGLGDYGGSAGGNQIMEGGDVPMTVNAGDNLSGDIYFSHREFVGNVSVSATNASGTAATVPSQFKLADYPINAAYADTFPWLSQIAQNFSLYKLQGCIFEYKPTSGEFAATGSAALGKVIMGTNYDPTAPPFFSSREMENYDYAKACKPSESMLHGIETAPQQAATMMLYTRTGETSKNKIFTDVGLFQIATEGIPLTVPANSTSTATIGELWVAYRVKLSRSKIFEALGEAGGYNNWFTIQTVSTTPWTQITPYVNNNDDITATNVVGSPTKIQFTFPSGRTSGAYMLIVNSYLTTTGSTGTFTVVPADQVGTTQWLTVSSTQFTAGVSSGWSATDSSGHYECGINITNKDTTTAPSFVLTLVTGGGANLPITHRIYMIEVPHKTATSPPV